jgi:hypothetical protein
MITEIYQRQHYKSMIDLRQVFEIFILKTILSPKLTP